VGKAGRIPGKAEVAVGGQAMLWFGIAGGAAALGLTLLYNRYVKRTPQAMRSGGSFTVFGLLMLLFAVGAAVAGAIAAQAGR
jgi:hypothetical protein